MFKIRNRDDLALSYMILMDPSVAKSVNTRYIQDFKREIRRYTHKKKDRRIVSDDGIDGYTVLIDLPEDISDEEAAERWFYWNEYRSARPSAYDCTGQPFTLTHKNVERRGRWYCYHTIRFDV